MPNPLDAPTLSLIRRVLCAHAPPTQPLSSSLLPLPPITQHPAIDLQLYALLAIVCRDYIDTWYTPISSDRDFISELITVVASVAREVERRIDNIDIPLLLLDELPALLTRHITDHRLAHARAGTTSHHSPAQLFHNLQPHPALDGETGEAAGQYNKLLANALLDALLPVESLPSPCARTFVRDLLAAMVLGGVVERMSEPRMMYGLIVSLLERRDAAAAASPSPPPPPPPTTATPPPPPEEAAEVVEGESKPPNQDQSQTRATHTPPPSIHIHIPIHIPPTLESTLATLLLLLHTLGTLAITLLHTLHTPPPAPARTKPFLAMAAVPLLPVYLGMPHLQPWLWGVVCLLLRPFTVTAPGQGLGRVGTVVDEMIGEKVDGLLGGGAGVAEALAGVRGVLFPGNAPMGAGAAGAGGVEVGVEGVRRRAVDVVVERVPEGVWGVWVGEGAREERRRWVEEWCVDVWSDKQVNRHLWYAVLDLLVARLVPELVEGAGAGAVGEEGEKEGGVVGGV